MSNSWVADRETTIYSKVKAKLTSKFIKTYPDINITQDGKKIVDPKFPNIFISFLQPVEQGKDLEGKTINAVLLTMQIDVSVSRAMGMTVANEVSWAIVDILKDMGFEASMPYFSSDMEEVYRSIARYSRVIGYNDTIE